MPNAQRTAVRQAFISFSNFSRNSSGTGSSSSPTVTASPSSAVARHCQIPKMIQCRKEPLPANQARVNVCIFKSLIASAPEELPRLVLPLPLRINHAAMSASGCHRAAAYGIPVTFWGSYLSPFTSCLSSSFSLSFSFWPHYYTVYFVCQHFFNNFVKNFFISSFFEFPAGIPCSDPLPLRRQ